MNALEVEGLAMAYAATEVLSDVGLTVPERSITAVLGSSGSGKTTLLRIIAGFERPRAGRVSLAGRIIEGPGRHVAPERRRLGYVPQEGALFPHLTVARNVGFGLRGRARRSGRVNELLELVGLAGLARRYPHELSGGEQQRVALARALALDPPVVLLDEPFSSLDAALRVSVRDDIAGVLRASGTSVVLVTHDQQEALSMADQVAVLRAGHIAQVGSPREIYAHPVDPELAAFLGEANLVDAEVRDGTAHTAFGHHPAGAVGAGGGEVRCVALIRPEQIAMSLGHNGSGLAGTVSAQTYQGHESVVTVVPDQRCGAAGLRVRIPGVATYSPGTAVTLTVAGAVAVWPADRSSAGRPPVDSTAAGDGGIDVESVPGGAPA